MKLPALKAARERKLLTQAELAAKAGVGEGTVNRLEAGKQEARFSTIKRLAEALGVDPEDLTAPSAR